MRIKKNNRITYFILLLLPFFLGTCGIEDYSFIYPIYDGNVQRLMNNNARVRVPFDNSGSPFTHFTVFYRIYVSDKSIPSTTSTSTFTDINSLLTSDYNYFSPYIDSDTLVNSNTANQFQGRSYKYLYLQNNDIERVLSANYAPGDGTILGKTLEFDFPSNSYPVLRVLDSSGNILFSDTLMRSNGDGEFTPHPLDRNFVNTEELWRSGNINATTNADVADKSGIAAAGDHYTYAALFIAGVGLDNRTISYIYSTPNLIHVFMLPNQW